jgi:hypothetical protein
MVDKLPNTISKPDLNDEFGVISEFNAVCGLWKVLKSCVVRGRLEDLNF